MGPFDLMKEKQRKSNIGGSTKLQRCLLIRQSTDKIDTEVSSSCRHARREASKEAVHLAAGVLAVGYQGVVAMM